MKGVNLSVGISGEEIKLLHSKLRQLDFDIPVTEAQREFFGPATRRAVQQFQAEHGLKITGEVDERTAAAINAAIASKRVPAMTASRDGSNSASGVPTRSRPLGASQENVVSPGVPVITRAVPGAAAPPPALPTAPRPPQTPDSRMETMIVRGVVRQADGSPLVGATVRAVDRDLRHEEPLGEAITGTDGRYEISYTADQFRRAEKRNADLIVRALDATGAVLAASPTIFNSRPVEIIDLVVGGGKYSGPSEYEQLLAEITPLLEETPIADLTEDEQHQDITFLAGETGQNPQRITFLILAHRMERTTGLLPEVFYGFFRQNMPTRLPALLLQSRRALRRALEAALRDNIIPAKLRDDIETTLDALKRLVGRHVLQSIDTESSFPTADLLRIAGLSGEEQEKVLNLFIENEGPVEDVWKTLRQDLRAGMADELQFTLQLGRLTGNNLPLVKALHDLRRGGTLQSLRDVARKLDARALTELVNKSASGEDGGIPPHVPGATREERVANYVNGIIETLKDVFPTTFIAQGIAKEPEVDLRLARQALERNPNLDLNEPLPADLVLTGISTADQAKARGAIESLRREIKMFPELDHKRLLEAPGSTGTASTRLQNPIRRGVAQFFANEPDFEFADTHIDKYLAGRPNAFNGIAEEER
ncbi:MAG: peptidoglycan-binding protein, partial [Acidobacteria bacterium]|nr:peptidoglycan-binding protein [Acidobacteriota bacterium]